jgi:hypothetical protein
LKIVPAQTLVKALLMALAILATLPLSAAPPAPKEPEVKPLEVTYFFLPG